MASWLNSFGTGYYTERNSAGAGGGHPHRRNVTVEDQKGIFSPDGCCRLPEIWPKALEPTVVSGCAGVCTFVRPNDSSRNCRVTRSMGLNLRCRLVSNPAARWPETARRGWAAPAVFETWTDLLRCRYLAPLSAVAHPAYEVFATATRSRARRTPCRSTLRLRRSSSGKRLVTV